MLQKLSSKKKKNLFLEKKKKSFTRFRFQILKRRQIEKQYFYLNLIEFNEIPLILSSSSIFCPFPLVFAWLFSIFSRIFHASCNIWVFWTISWCFKVEMIFFSLFFVGRHKFNNFYFFRWIFCIGFWLKIRYCWGILWEALQEPEG